MPFMKKNNFKLKLKSKLFLIILSVFITLVSIFSYYHSVFEVIELNSLDFRFKHFPIPERADSTIVLIAIDQQSLQFAQKNNVFWPWPREFYALITDFLTDTKAKQIIFDILFYEPDYERLHIDSESSDYRFAESLKRSGKVVLGAQASLGHTEDEQYLPKVSLNIKKELNEDSYYKSVLLPIKKFHHKRIRTGLLNIEPDLDGVVRRVPLVYQINDKFLPNISLMAWLNTELKNEKDILQTPFIFRKNYMKVLNRKIPLFKNDNVLINWYGKGDVGGVFRYIPFSALVQTASAVKYGGNPSLEPSMFKDKTILIGATAPGLLDLKTIPTTKIVPGMEIWATLLSNLYHNDFIKEMPLGFNIVLSFVLSLMIIIVFAYKSNTFSHICFVIILIVMHLIVYFLWQERIFIPWFLYILTIFLSYISIILINYIVEGRSKIELRRIFSRYVHPDLINILLKNADIIEMGGEEIQATVLFSDIYNFTDYSEKIPPKQLVSELNIYFETFTSTILNHNGMLDKYTGDGLMAVFGVPLLRKDHAYLACKAAIEHKNYALSLNPNDKFAFFHQKTRIGINSGTIVAGNIGSVKRADYTAIGDSVNLSARLESVNKIFKTSIIIGESTWFLVKDKFLCRELDILKVKGKNEPTRIFELIDFIENSTDLLEKLICLYNNALTEYRSGNFQNAKELFDSLYLSEFNDYPSKVMSERCDYLIINSPESWDGIFKLTVK